MQNSKNNKEKETNTMPSFSLKLPKIIFLQPTNRSRFCPVTCIQSYVHLSIWFFYMRPGQTKMLRYFQTALKNKFLNLKQMQTFGISSHIWKSEYKVSLQSCQHVFNHHSANVLRAALAHSHCLLADNTLSLSLPLLVSWPQKKPQDQAAWPCGLQLWEQM